MELGVSLCRYRYGLQKNDKKLSWPQNVHPCAAPCWLWPLSGYTPNTKHQAAVGCCFQRAPCCLQPFRYHTPPRRAASSRRQVSRLACAGAGRWRAEESGIQYLHRAPSVDIATAKTSRARPEGRRAPVKISTTFQRARVEGPRIFVLAPCKHAPLEAAPFASHPVLNSGGRKACSRPRLKLRQLPSACRGPAVLPSAPPSAPLAP